MKTRIRPHRVRWVVAAALLAIAAVGAVAYAAPLPSPAIQTSTPRSERDITNLDVLRQQIRNYYGDPLGTGTFSADSNYAREAEGVADEGSQYLAGARGGSPGHGEYGHGDNGHGNYGHGVFGHGGYGHGSGGAHFPFSKGHRAATRDNGNGASPSGTSTFGGGSGSGTKAIVLDVDDTTLATWNYEVASNWAYNPTTNGSYVDGQLFPAVPGMVQLVNQAAQEGYAIFFITGRPASQEASTLGNLTHDGVGVDAGYPAPTTLSDGEDGLFTKPATTDYPQYLKTACAADPNGACTTSDYKTATRAHIESLGYDIVANFGDQFSDLVGGYADKTFKLPNPNYFLP